MNSMITKDAELFFKNLETYMKHKKLEIEVTLKNGNTVLLQEQRKITSELAAAEELLEEKPKDVEHKQESIE